MEFWGLEVKPGTTIKCEPGHGFILHLSQAALGESKKSDSALVYVKVDDQKFAVGTLSIDKYPHIQCDLIFDKEFELSHTSKTTSVFFTGYKVEQPTEEDEMDLDSEDEGELNIPAIKENGAKLMGRSKKVKRRQLLPLQNQVLLLGMLKRKARMMMILMRMRQMIQMRERDNLLKKAMMMIQVMRMIPVRMRKKLQLLIRSQKQARRDQLLQILRELIFLIRKQRLLQHRQLRRQMARRPPHMWQLHTQPSRRARPLQTMISQRRSPRDLVGRSLANRAARHSTVRWLYRLTQRQSIGLSEPQVQSLKAKHGTSSESGKNVSGRPVLILFRDELLFQQNKVVV